MNNQNKVITTILLALGLLVLCPIVEAVSPSPDGGYPGFNTAEGQNALNSLTTGVANAAVGWFSLFSNTDGSYNTALGAGTLLFNIGDQSTGDGIDNTAIGAAALLLNTTGADNTAVGVAALSSNTTGAADTATGSGALLNNNTGTANTATGADALLSNTTGIANTATGAGALVANTVGINNTGTGFSALSANMTGNGNTAVGRYALSTTTGSGNTALGAAAGSALTTGANNIDIGVDVSGVAGESNTIRIGANLAETPGASACHIGGIYNQSVDPATASSMAIDVTGKLGTPVSSQRFKHDIKPMDKTSQAILALRPVTFYYKTDKKNTPCYGLIAEEVAKTSPDLVIRDKNGEPLTVRYEQINAMLLNEFLKEHRKVEQQADLIARQQKQIDALAAGLQKVSAQLEVTKASPQTVLNNQ
jgi:Chaperone of endosialidase